MAVLGKFRKAWGLSWADWLFLVEVSIFLPVVRILLRIMPFRTLVRLFSGKTVFVENSALNPDRSTYLMELASHYHMLRPSCLEKALVLYAVLRRQGITADLAIGTMKKNGQFKAHAWVKYQGRVILGNYEEPYTQLFVTSSARNLRQPT